MPTHLSDVTTEPQHRVLNEMSRQLVQKLDAMIAEQDERVRAFTEKQHSLSALPHTQSPLPQPAHETTHSPVPIPPDSRETPLTAADDAPHYREEAVEEADEPDFEIPRSEPVRQHPVRRSVSDAPPLPFTRPAFTKKQTEQKETNASALLIGLGVFILFLLIRSCN